MSSTCKVAVLASLALAALAFAATCEGAIARTYQTNTHYNSHEDESRSTRRPQLTLTIGTSSGHIKGSCNAEHGCRFLSVPYAKPPQGPLRFMAPQPIDQTSNSTRWHPIDATHYGPTCPQLTHMAHFVSSPLRLDTMHRVSEDCLHLHVYTPRLTETQNNIEDEELLPVIAWIPGEGFDFADARQFDGSRLAKEANAVVVSIQYRVGSLGFLSSKQLGIDGNMGIKDQAMALDWIRKNARAFGGNPQNINAFGRFTGSMSLLTLATAPNDTLKAQLPLRRIGLLSGIPVDGWIVDEKQGERANQLAKSLGCPAGKLECMQQLKVEDIVDAAGFAWRPSRDDQLVGDDLTAQAVAKSNLAPQIEAVLLGQTSAEGTLCLYRHLVQEPNAGKFAKRIETDTLSEQDVDEMILDDSRFYFGLNDNNVTSMTTVEPEASGATTDTIAQIELALGVSVSVGAKGTQKHQDESHASRYVRLCSAYLVTGHAQELKRKLLAPRRSLRSDSREPMRLTNSRRIRVYEYELRYKPSFSKAPQYVPVAAHGDDIPLLFGSLEQEGDDSAAARKLVDLLARFVRDSSSSGKWSSNEPSRFVIDTNDDQQQASSSSEVATVEVPASPKSMALRMDAQSNQTTAAEQRVIVIEEFWGAQRGANELTSSLLAMASATVALVALVCLLASVAICFALARHCQASGARNSSCPAQTAKSTRRAYDLGDSSHAHSNGGSPMASGCASCLCGGSQSSTMDAMLGGEAPAGKHADPRAFGTVFAKLRHSPSQPAIASPPMHTESGAPTNQ